MGDIFLRADVLEESIAGVAGGLLEVFLRGLLPGVGVVGGAVCGGEVLGEGGVGLGGGAQVMIKVEDVNIFGVDVGAQKMI